MNRITTYFCATLIALTASNLHAVEFGYSVATNNHLYQIDLTSGSATDLGLVNLNQTEGMAFNGTTLLGIGGPIDPQATLPQELWNLTVPPGSFIGNTAVTTNDDSGLAAHNGQLWAVRGQAFDSKIIELNPVNGASIQQGDITESQFGIYVDSLAIDSNGNAFAVDPALTDPLGALYSLDLTGSLGTATLIGALGISDIDNPQSPLLAQSGLDFDSANTLYLLLSDGRLYTINTTTGAASFIDRVEDNGNPLRFQGGFAIGNLNAVNAAIIPEPATMIMVVLGAGAVFVRPRARPCAEPSGRR